MTLRTALPLLLAAACAVGTDADPAQADALSQAAPPPVIDMCKAVHAIPGETTSVTVSGLPAGGRAFLGLGFREQTDAFCPNALRGECIDIVLSSTFGPVNADANGDATFMIPIPASAPVGATGYLQAAYPAGVDSAVTNVVAMTLAADTSDLSACMDADVCANPDDDGDMVPNACEIAGCTDMAAMNYDPMATDDDGSCMSAGTVIVDFEGAPTLTGFGGAEDSTVVVDPTDPTNMVGRVLKSDAAELWAGTTISYCDANGIAVLPLTATDTQMMARVWSPTAGTPIRLKVENSANAGVSVETDTLTTMAGAWETLVFDFANEAPGTAAFDASMTYDKASIFFNFGTTGADAGEQVYYVDDLSFPGPMSTDCPVVMMGEGLPLTFDDPATTYVLAGFGGAEAAAVVPDPADPSNMVAEVTKADTAELWAGTTMSSGPNFSIEDFPLDVGATAMTLRVRSPRAGIPIRLKVEDAGDPTRSVETEAMTTGVNTWETLTFDFANEAPGTAAWNPAFTYNKASVFLDFGTAGVDGGGGTFWFENLDMAP